jgi:hypothetical protein
MRIDNAFTSHFPTQRLAVPSAGQESSFSAALSSANIAGLDKVTTPAVSKNTATTFASGATAQGAEPPSLAYRNMALRNAKTDPEYAKKTAYELAYNDSYVLHGPMVDITHNPIRYSATGEAVSDQGLTEFKAMAAQARSELIGIYQKEKSKGTPDPEILEKLFSARDGQHPRYLQLLNWALPSREARSA